jgi:hypothetical protein
MLTAFYYIPYPTYAHGILSVIFLTHVHNTASVPVTIGTGTEAIVDSPYKKAASDFICALRLRIFTSDATVGEQATSDLEHVTQPSRRIQ